MKPILRRLIAASSGALVALSMSVSAAGASTPGDEHRPARFPHGPVQVADQVAGTDQDARSFAQSEQIIPINANVPVQILSLGRNGGDTKQSNSSSASSAAVNQAGTEQSVDQHQSYPKGHSQVPKTDGWKDRGKDHGPKGHDGWSGHGPKDRCPTRPDGGKDHDGWKDHGKKDHDGWKDHGRKDHGSKPPVQVADQRSWTDQDAESTATSKQFAPINVNAPIQILSLGKNGGDTKQSNSSSASSTAVNSAGTEQSTDQDQSAPAKGGWGHDGGAFQGASQGASTDQQAQSAATSKQILPVNVNAPIQVLSLGANGGDTKQWNSSAAESAAANKARTDQSADQQQAAGGSGGPAFQGASQGASTEQDATSVAKSEQVLPVNLNVPVQVLSQGHNGGDTAQSNSSSAESFAGNQAGTSQAVGQAQGLLGGLG